MPSLTQILNIINESSPQDNPEEFTFPWYTTCIKWEDYSPLSKTTLIALGVLAGAGLLAAPFFGPIGLVGVVVGFICGYSAIHQAFGYFLHGKLICLGEENAVVCGTVTHLEPPEPLGKTDFFDWLDNDFSWNLLVCPYKLVERLDASGNIWYPPLNPIPPGPPWTWTVSDADTPPPPASPTWDPEPYNTVAQPMDYYCLETQQVTNLRKQFPTNYQVGGSTNDWGTSVVAANSFAAKGQGQVNIPTVGLADPADVYFSYLSQPASPPPVLPLPSTFPVPVQRDSNRNAIPVFGQSDDPSGRAAGYDPGAYQPGANQQASYAIGTTGQSAQIHCEIEGSRINNSQTGSNVVLGILTTAAALAAAAATVPGIGWLFALLILLLALIIAAAVLAGSAFGSDNPNVNGGSSTDTQPNSGQEGPTNTLNLNVGDFVVVVGRWVFDMWHCPSAGSNEIHPVKQVYCPTAPIIQTNFCTTFCDLVKPLINNSTSTVVLTNQSLPENNWTVHPIIDGCRPVHKD